MTQTPDLPHYRPCVGIIMFNTQGQVWLGKRLEHDDPHCWQFPQGGIDPGETPRDAALREVWEETGANGARLTPLGRTDDWLTYDYPEDYKVNPKRKNWLGQKQHWFAYRFHEDDECFDLKAHPPQEFSEWRWGNLHETPDLIIPFKRKVYEELVIIFSPFAKP